MTLGFRFEEQPALHSVLALSSLIVDQRALHSVVAFVYASDKPLLIPEKGFSPRKVISKSCKPAAIVAITKAIAVIHEAVSQSISRQ